MNRLYILYDERCGLCRWARRWAMEQPTFVELCFLAAGSEAAARIFPDLAKSEVPEELVAVSDGGQVYRGDSAWIMCLFAMREYREWSLRLATPVLRPFARQAFSLISQQRGRISWWLGLSDRDTAEALRGVEIVPCELATAASPLQCVSE